MANKDTQQQDDKQPKRTTDFPLIIKIIILIFLLLLLFVEIYNGEFTHLAEFGSSSLILLFKLLLIALVLWLIRVQRDLRCEITVPTGCVKEQSDLANGILFVKIEGTASGGVFGHYTLELKQDSGPIITSPDPIIYPSGGGGTPVIGGELGRINTMSLSDGAYTITLTVYPAGAGSLKVCTITFTLLKVMVLIDAVGDIPVISIPDNHNPLDPDAELRKHYASPSPEYRPVAVGGNISINGMAYVYGCEDRKLSKYEIRYDRVTTPGSEPSQPANLTPIPANWSISDRIVDITYSAGQHWFWNKLGPAATNLIRKWGTIKIGTLTFPILKEQKWSTANVDSGQYSLLLTGEDSLGFLYHDMQRVWFDNFPVHGHISGIEDVDPCAELQLSQFSSSGMNILGYAWDSLIDSAFPDTAPNDNFDHYRLRLYKQGGGDYDIGNYSTRVINPMRNNEPPPTPTSGEEDLLANFDIATIIDAANPASDSDVNIPRNESCAYYLRLDVWDNSRLNDDSNVHHAHSIWPFCIMNDLTTEIP